MIAPAQTVGRAGHTDVRSELWRANTSNTLLEDITTENITGAVTANIHLDIKSALSLQHLDTELTPYADVLAPFITLIAGDGTETRHQAGLFIYTPPKGQHQPTHSQWIVEAKDLTWLLANDSFDDPYNAAEGANPITLVRAIIDGLGLRHEIPDSAYTLTKAVTYDADMSKLAICNALLNAAGYYTLWANRFGVLRSFPYFTLAEAEPVAELFSGEGSPVINAIQEEGTYEGLANRVVVHKPDTIDEPLTVTLVNNDPLSPISIQNLGRTITRWEINGQFTNTLTMTLVGMRILEESASYTRKLRVETLPMPDRELHEVFDTAIYNDAGQLIAYGPHWCDGYSMGFDALSATTVLNLKRLERFGGTVAP